MRERGGGGPLCFGCDPIGATSESVINARNSSDMRESFKLKRSQKKILTRSDLFKFSTILWLSCLGTLARNSIS